jgi:hypothetical protein
MVSGAVTKKRLHVRSVVWHVMTTIIAIFWSLPARMIANCWHYVYEIPVPRRWLRVVYQAYARYWHMRLEEAEKPLEEYETLKKVFTRSLKPGLRTIDRSASFVSPIDGSIIMHGLLHAVPPHQGVQEVEEAERRARRTGTTLRSKRRTRPRATRSRGTRAPGRATTWCS